MRDTAEVLLEELEDLLAEDGPLRERALRWMAESVQPRRTVAGGSCGEGAARGRGIAAGVGTGQDREREAGADCRRE